MFVVSRVAIVGAGNLGSFLASALSCAGHEVFFCVRRLPSPVQVEGCPVLKVRFFLRDPPEADIVLLTVKVYDTPCALSWLAPLTNGRQPTAVVQNGIHHLTRVAPFPAIPVLSLVYIERQGGVYRAFMPPPAHFSVPAGAASEPFVHLFDKTSIQIRQEPDFHTSAWLKMLQNCVSNPLTALAGRGLEILAEPAYRKWAKDIVNETLPIAQADGAEISCDEAQTILELLVSYPRGTRTSMLQDREKGKQLEVEALNGMIVELGRRYKLPTPVNQELVNLLQLPRL
ncbi:MAG: ketopantoate reductase family protein [Bryobacteraceae bacterium]